MNECVEKKYMAEIAVNYTFNLQKAAVFTNAFKNIHLCTQNFIQNANAVLANEQ